MNLYYKKRGKQKHDTQQPVSATQPLDANGNPVAPAAPVQPVAPAAPAAPASGEPAAAPTAPAAPTEPTPAPSGKAVEPAADPSTDSELPPADDDSDTKSSAPSSSPATPPPAPSAPAVPEKPKVDLPTLTKQFALEKGWTSTPYGDWNDKTGRKVAVTGLGLEVVPLEHVDRETLKTFVDRKTKA